VHDHGTFTYLDTTISTAELGKIMRP
jgi:hypothetical protein